SRCRWRDICVLYRIHSHRDEVAAELARRAIPFSIEGLDVLDTPEVRDLLASLAATVSAGETSALLRVAAFDQFSISSDELRAALGSLPRETKSPMAAALAKLERGRKILEELKATREAIRGRKIHDALVAASSSFQIPHGPPVATLVEFAKAWETSPLAETASPAEFLEYLDDFREARGTIPLARNEEGDRVQLMSVHGAKGLEFDHVFIVRAVKGSFPCHYREALIELAGELRHSGLALGEEKQIYEQEERRLFYVAMTRARDTLTIYGQFGRGERDKTPPGFLRELVKHRDLKPYFRHRTCREFQTTMFGAAEAGKISRLAEWVTRRPAVNLASTLSASAIDRYRTCPLQFKLEREWRIPSEMSAAVAYGASVHRVLLAYFVSLRRNRALSPEQLIELFRVDFAGETVADPYQRELYERQAITQLKEFIAGVESAPPEVLHTEEQFSMKIGETTLVGRIDRIDRAPDNRVIITDYKTGKPRSEDDADGSLQLSLYALAAREKWGYRTGRLVFHNLDGNVRVTTVRSDMELEEARQTVTEVAAKIAQGNFNPTPGFHCSWCSYRSLCPKTEKRVPGQLSVSASQPAAKI
ncbi:MAG: ATP-dependent helicase, partial [Acidobacteria bacterium]|nr:ATP-dependent helicase [Acidobacteriota bacterium]